jgi:hypothetical protein
MDLSISKKVSTIEKDYMLDLLSRGTRIDGRGFLEYREIKIDAGPMLKAEGSARVCIGDTQVCCGVKYDTGTPFPDSPNEGVITAMAEYVPFASPMFESGPPDENAIELARVVDRGIRHSDLVDRSTLVIKPGQEVFLLFVDLYYMMHNGNPWDTASLAALCALKTTMIHPGLPGHHHLRQDRRSHDRRSGPHGGAHRRCPHQLLHQQERFDNLDPEERFGDIHHRGARQDGKERQGSGSRAAAEGEGLHAGSLQHVIPLQFPFFQVTKSSSPMEHNFISRCIILSYLKGGNKWHVEQKR